MSTIYTDPVFLNTPVPASATLQSQIINLDSLKPEGYFSLQYDNASLAELDFDYLLSNDGDTFSPDDGAAAIVAGVINTNGFVAFYPSPAKYMIITVAEVGGAIEGLANAVLTIQ